MDLHTGLTSQQENVLVFNSDLDPFSYNPRSKSTTTVIFMQPSAEVGRQLDSIPYNQLSWFFKLIRAGPAWFEVCSCLEPCELVRIASLCLFTLHRIIADTRIINAVSRWKLNPAGGWAHFYALMQL
jgi:hypothetical protein